MEKQTRDELMENRVCVITTLNLIDIESLSKMKK